jgi:uncharacterized protein involved in exopolysaccharide biosynthesis/Mrp family chromosome partitioning ATPase
VATAVALDGQDLPDDLPAAPGPAAPEPNPIGGLVRAMRGRWKLAVCAAALLGPAFATAGFLAGSELYSSQAILRVFPQESNILYATGDDSVLKTFDSFVKAETTYVASNPVMERAAATLRAAHPDLAADLKATDLAGSIEIKRNDSLIVLTTKSRDAAFVSAKLGAVVTAYLELKAEADAARTAVRLEELRTREADLVARLAALRSSQLEIGGEFGSDAIVKAHVEKIAQIDAIAARKSEVAATLATLEADAGSASADMSDQEILRATLLDRGLADLSFERAKKLSELANIRARLADHMPEVLWKREEIAVIEAAIADRREQIRILGQTGALTDTSAGSAETSLTEIRALYDKVAEQLDAARADARDLNRRRVELDAISKEVAEAQELLEETRRALEVIVVESGRALPGFTALMSPPSEPAEPSEDNRKLLAAGGLAGGAGLALFAALGLGLAERRLRFAETLAPVAHLLPVVQVSAAGPADREAADRLRNEIQLRPLRAPRLARRAPVIAVVRPASGVSGDLAQALAESYARARMRTLLIDADLGGIPAESSPAGLREAIADGTGAAPPQETADGLFVLPAGRNPAIRDDTVAAPAIRAVIDRLADGFDAVIVSAGSLEDRLASRFVLAAADIAVADIRPSDPRATILRHAQRLDGLPRHGAVAVLRDALPGDPWIAIRS